MAKQKHYYSGATDKHQQYKPWWKRLFSGEKSEDFAHGKARKQKKQSRCIHRTRIKARNKRRIKRR